MVLWASHLVTPVFHNVLAPAGTTLIDYCLLYHLYLLIPYIIPVTLVIIPLPNFVIPEGIPTGTTKPKLTKLLQITF